MNFNEIKQLYHLFWAQEYGDERNIFGTISSYLQLLALQKDPDEMAVTFAQISQVFNDYNKPSLASKLMEMAADAAEEQYLKEHLESLKIRQFLMKELDR